MCAIAGIPGFNQAMQARVEEMEIMLGALYHHGPDISGIYIDDRVALGHNRLSIVGLSDGAQPIDKPRTAQRQRLDRLYKALRWNQ